MHRPSRFRSVQEAEEAKGTGAKGNVEALLAPHVIESIRREIEAAGGNEIFCVGTTGASRLVEGAEVVARGDSSSVPAFFHSVSFGDVVIHNHPEGPLTPSKDDLTLASGFGNLGVGFYIVDNAVSDIYVVVEAFARKPQAYLDPARVVPLLEPGGAVAAELAHYEHRPQQVELARAVVEALNTDSVAMVEAGTGTGKTLAYLIPAALWAVENRERVLVSTYTINLQEQLLGKDIPLVRRAVDVPFKAVLAKGRGNYVCLRKADALARDFTLLVEPQEAAVMQALLEWAWKTDDGSLSDLNFVPRQEVWEKVMSEADSCPRAKCAFYGACPFYRARREAASADVLVVNHHLLFADIALRSELGTYTELAIIPTYKRIIVDEAHNVEDVATSYLGLMVSRHGLLRLLDRLHRLREGERGLLPYVKAALQTAADPLPQERVGWIVEGIDREIVPLKDQAAQLCQGAFDRIYHLAEEVSEDEVGERRLRFGEAVRAHADWGSVVEEFQFLVGVLRELVMQLSDVERELRALEEHATEKLEAPLIELAALRGRLEATLLGTSQILFQDREDEVRWVEARPGRKGSVVHLRMAPLDISRRMHEVVYSKFPTVVFTSATLSTEGTFGYMRGRLGLDLVEEARRRELLLPSAFDYRRQVVFGIPIDIPDPREAEYPEEVFKLIYDVLAITNGRAFVLFTSIRMLGDAFAALEAPLRGIGIRSWKQGDDTRDRLLRSFREDTTSVLFGTDSFWQGVDVEGEALECVILVKLPFKVPTDPVQQARAEAIDRQGGNSFFELVVPQAVLKFKQGFGRLIRRRTDRGALLVLDKRIVQRRYGKLFINSLPACNIVLGTSEKVLESLRQFFQDRVGGAD